MALRRDYVHKRRKPKAGEIVLHAEDRLDDEQEASERPIQFGLLRRLFRYLWPHWRLLFWLVLINVSATVIGSVVYLELVRRATRGTKQGQVDVVLWAALGMLAVGLVASILDALTDRRSAKLGQTVVHDLRMAIFNHLQRLHLAFFDRTKQGRLISRMTSDVGTLEQLFSFALPTLIWAVFQVIVVCAYLIWLNWRLFVAVSWLVPALAICTRVFQPWVIRAWRELRIRVSRLTSYLAENVQGIRVVQAFTREQTNLAHFDELGRRFYDSRMRATLRFNFYFGVIGLIGGLGTAVVFARGQGLVGLSASLGGISAEDVVAFIFAMDRFFGPIRSLGDLYNQALAAMAGGERIFSLLDTEPEIKDLPDAVDLPTIEGELVFDHASFGYTPERLVLHDLNIKVKPGETVALVGPTGAGKSSTINLLCRFYEPTEGRVLVDGHDIRHVTLDSLHRQMGIVLQDSFLFSGTVMDNIKFGRPDATDTEVILGAQDIGAHETIENLRNGYETVVSERGESLSAGERQLVCFTRAMVANPRILILDEATSAVDSQTEYRVQQALEKLVERRTTVVVAHRLSTVRNADQVLVVEDGRIVERGTHDSLLTAGGIYTRMYKEFLRSG